MGIFNSCFAFLFDFDIIFEQNLIFIPDFYIFQENLVS